MNPWVDFLLDSLGFGATFMYGSTGEILTEKAGHLNLGIPGVMCMGGAGGCLMLNLIGESALPPFLIVILGILASFLTGALMGLIYSFLTVTLRANQNVTGLALTTFGVGLMKVLMSDKTRISVKRYLVTPKQYFRFPFAGRSDSLQVLGVMFFLAVIVACLSSYVLYRTRTGLNLRAVGENPGTADAAGINVTRYKYLATCIGSGIAGLGGLYYIIDYMASQEAYLSIEAYGWLSIALVIFVLWKPHMTIPGSFIFGVLFSCSSHIANIPWITVTVAAKPILKMLPYLFTIVVLIISSIRNKRENQPPSSLGLSYFREDR
ncbi:MAG: ABC transporter permease [Clostridia bacterium]|nr:ABC transporter permease [Clostridia bacterium]